MLLVIQTGNGFASTRAQLEFAAELGLISVDEALASIRHGMDEALQRAREDSSSMTDRIRERIWQMVEVGIRKAV